ncbi:MAG: RNA polymerase sigma factor [Bacteroidota bacterium]
MSSDFYEISIAPFAGIIIKICRAYTDNQADFEDYYQEVCLQIWRSKDSYNGKSAWATWVYRVALNVCLTLIKKRKEQPQDPHEQPAKQVASVENQAFANESLNQLYAAIRQLSEIDRAVILLYLEEKSYQEIATVIGGNANSIGVRISRIKTRLKKLLHGQFN